MDKSRTELLIGSENLKKIESKHVTIVGVGGVGGYVALMLARAGVKRFKLIDYDKISSSNINRQVVATTSSIGLNKVDIMKEIILSINDEAEVAVINDKLSENNVSKYISNTDVVIDAIDCVVDKVALIIYCKKNNLNIISAMGAGNRFDVPNFYLTDIYKTHDDGLAKVVRKKLRENNKNNLKNFIAKK